jgi:hypothetical protein
MTIRTLGTLLRPEAPAFAQRYGAASWRAGEPGLSGRNGRCGLKWTDGLTKRGQLCDGGGVVGAPATKSRSERRIRQAGRRIKNTNARELRTEEDGKTRGRETANQR